MAKRAARSIKNAILQEVGVALQIYRLHTGKFLKISLQQPFFS